MGGGREEGSLAAATAFHPAAISFLFEIHTYLH